MLDKMNEWFRRNNKYLLIALFIMLFLEIHFNRDNCFLFKPTYRSDEQPVQWKKCWDMCVDGDVDRMNGCDNYCNERYNP